MAEEQTVRVHLNGSVGQRLPGERTPSKYYGPGDVDVPISLAQSLGLSVIQGESVVVDEQRDGVVGRPQPSAEDILNGQAPIGENLQPTGTPGTAEPTGTTATDTPPAQPEGGKYDGWKDGDLQAEADFRNLKVTRAEGEGEPQRSDYVRALEENDAANAGK